MQLSSPYSSSAERIIHTVSQLNREVRYLLEDCFLSVWVEGEISNLKSPGSGHLYFTLKDEHAQIRCALFRMSAQNLTFRPKDGLHVILKGRVSLYEPRGDFQIIAEYMEEAGHGALQRAFEALKKRLAEEGLFDSLLKKPLPKFPRKIGVITSPTGAAIRDILSVLKRRFCSISILIYPVLVQGNEAAGQIVKALKLANARQECDLLILARGGGSLEDLWPFNEEIVARAIYESHLPIVTGVGHEIDFTIADFVADHRAPTPSAAAELVSPDIAEFQQILFKQRMRLAQSMKIFLRHTALILENLKKQLPHPKKRLQDQAQLLDHLEQRLILALQYFLKHKAACLAHVSLQLKQHIPTHQITLFLAHLQSLEQTLKKTFEKNLQLAHEKVKQLMRALDNVSPLNTLDRGYAIVTLNGKVIEDASLVKAGDTIEARVARGKIVSVVV